MDTETLQCFRQQTLSKQTRRAINKLTSPHLKHEDINEKTGKKRMKEEIGA